MAEAISIGFIGFGEVGQTFSKGLLRTPGVTIAAWDKLFGQPRGERLLSVAEDLGVGAATSVEQCCAGVDVIISAVTADQAEIAARDAARFLAPGQTFLDVNSAAPSTKMRAAECVQQSGAHYVEGAVMAPVLQPGLRVQILTGGPKAVEISGRLNALGMNLEPVATEHGRASATKLCRSIIIKGLEALMVDCAAASSHWGVQEDVFASLGRTFPSIDWAALSENMGERVATHGVRRAAEMREAAEMIESLGLDGGLARAVADTQERNAKPKP